MHESPAHPHATILFSQRGLKAPASGGAYLVSTPALASCCPHRNHARVTPPISYGAAVGAAHTVETSEALALARRRGTQSRGEAARAGLVDAVPRGTPLAGATILVGRRAGCAGRRAWTVHAWLGRLAAVTGGVQGMVGKACGRARARGGPRIHARSDYRGLRRHPPRAPPQRRRAPERGRRSAVGPWDNMR